jgi:hypothetical protein
VTNPLSGIGVSDPIARFRNDLRRRYPDSLGKSSDRPADGEAPAKPPHRLEKMPPEIGVLLIVVGTAGVLLPGPVGMPFLLAGGLSLWPSAFRKIEGWFERMSPRLYEEGMRQMERYLADLERRYPGSTR